MNFLVDGRPPDDWPGIKGCDWGMGSRVYVGQDDGSHVRAMVVGAAPGPRGWRITVRMAAPFGFRQTVEVPFDRVQRAWPTLSCRVELPCCGAERHLVYRGPAGERLQWPGVACECGQTYQFEIDDVGYGYRWERCEDLYPNLPRLVCWAGPRSVA